MTGNCLHSDATSKFHKHYQGFQIYSTSGKFYSAGKAEMGDASAKGVMDLFNYLLQELSGSVVLAKL